MSGMIAARAGGRHIALRIAAGLNFATAPWRRRRVTA
jgi:hypothetical protein